MRDFSLKRLEELFALGQKHGHVFWRHDVDFSLDAALKMARFEAERGISSTYYLFFTPQVCPFYTPKEALQVEKELNELGHNVGDHVDERKVGWINNQPVIAWSKLVSFHCPTERVLWRKFDGFRSACEPQWRGFYWSDSRGQFAYGDPEEYLQYTNVPIDVHTRQVQVNLHPEWWFEPDWTSKVPRDEYERFFYESPPPR